MKSFITDCLTLSKNSKTSSPDLHIAFLKWAENKGFETAEYENKNKFHKHFKDELSRAGMVVKMRKIQGKKFYVGFEIKM